MRVYFGGNFWGNDENGENRLPGEALWLEEQFEWLGRQCRIPAVYVCEEGIVADICICIPAEEIERFLTKWKPRMEHLSDEEWEEADRENPMDEDFHAELRINGELSEGWSGCGICWYPPYLRAEGEASDAVSDNKEELREMPEEEILNAYGCSREFGWRFCRQSWPWPEGRKEPLRTLDFVLKKGDITYSGVHFHTVQGEKKNVEFIHPVSGVRHTLTVQELNQSQLPAEHVSALRQGQRRLRKTPEKFLAMQYTVEPELPAGELQIVDCAKSDSPIMEDKSGVSAASVSIIGGADGPVSVFLMGKDGCRDSNLRSACSALHFEPVDTVEWRMRFHIKSHEEKQVKIIL